MGCNYGDLDNDGYLDFCVGTGDLNLETLIPNRMFRNAEGKFFKMSPRRAGSGICRRGTLSVSQISTTTAPRTFMR